MLAYLVDGIALVKTAYILAAMVSLVLSDSVAAQVRVKGYVRKDGTYVQPHFRSRPDGNPHNNWSTRGNVNPYTGKTGTQYPPGTTPVISFPPLSNTMPTNRSYQDVTYDRLDALTSPASDFAAPNP